MGNETNGDNEANNDEFEQFVNSNPTLYNMMRQQQCMHSNGDRYDVNDDLDDIFNSGDCCNVNERIEMPPSMALCQNIFNPLTTKKYNPIHHHDIRNWFQKGESSLEKLEKFIKEEIKNSSKNYENGAVNGVKDDNCDVNEIMMKSRYPIVACTPTQDPNEESWDQSETSSSETVIFDKSKLLIMQMKFLYHEIGEVCPDNITSSHCDLDRASSKYCKRFNLPRMNFMILLIEGLLPMDFSSDLDKIIHRNKFRIIKYLSQKQERQSIMNSILILKDNDHLQAQQIRFLFDEIYWEYPNKIDMLGEHLLRASHNFCKEYDLPLLSFVQLQNEGLLPTNFDDNNITTRNKLKKRITEFRRDYEEEGIDFEDLESFLANEFKSPKAVAFFNKILCKKEKDSFACSKALITADNRYNDNLTDQEKEQLLVLYTQSIANADCDKLPQAYGSRSRSLFSVKKYKESLADVNRALAFSVNNSSFTAELMRRKIECLAALNPRSSTNYLECESLLHESEQLMEESKERSNASDNFSSTAKGALNMKKTKLNGSLNDTQKLKIPEHVKLYHHRRSGSFQNDVDIRFHDKEKFLYAKRDYAPGDIVYIEEPAVAFFKFEHAYTNCSYCYAKSWSTVPCDYCNWVMFCKEECKHLAWKEFHDIECSVVSHVHTIKHDFTLHDFLTLRCLLQGIRKAGGLQKLKDEVAALDKSMKYYQENPDMNVEHFLNGFKSIYTVNSSQKITKTSVFVKNCEKILMILAKETKFFGENVNFDCAAELAENKDVLFFGKVFLKLRLNISWSAHELRDLKFINNSHNFSKQQNCKGVTFAPLSVLLEHSCYPNAKIFITNHMSLILFALRPIKAGSQLFISVDSNFLELNKEDRKELIKKNWHFNCDCLACMHNWPSLQEMYEMPMNDTELFCRNYWIPDQIEMFHRLTPLVKPILCNHKGTKVSQKTVTRLSGAITEAMVFEGKNVPSIVIGELMICLSKVLNTIYNVMD